MGVLEVTRWPGALLFAVAGLSAVVFAFVTVNLFALAMANLSFIERHGLAAIREGALIQLAGLVAWGVLALAAYLVFKICEVELTFRYFRWAGRGAEAENHKALRFRRETEQDETL